MICACPCPPILAGPKCYSTPPPQFLLTEMMIWLEPAPPPMPHWRLLRFRIFLLLKKCMAKSDLICEKKPEWCCNEKNTCFWMKISLHTHGLQATLHQYIPGVGVKLVHCSYSKYYIIRLFLFNRMTLKTTICIFDNNMKSWTPSRKIKKKGTKGNNMNDILLL